MSTSIATSGFGSRLLRGDGGAGAGVQASKTIGATTHQLRVKSRLAGTGGNSKTFGIVVDAGSVSYSQVITKNSVLVNSATTTGTATTTAAGALVLLTADATFNKYFIADFSSGDGSGILTAGASGALSGGSAGGEAFTDVSEIKSIGGPQHGQALIEVTHMASPGQYREYIGSFLDAGEVTFPMNFTNVASQLDVLDDLQTKRKGNYQIICTTEAGDVQIDFVCLVTKFDHSFDMNSALSANVTLKITGEPTYTDL